MAGRQIQKIQFDVPPTVADLADAVEDLRSLVGPNAVVRVLGVIEFDLNGTRIAAITASREDG